LLIRRIGVIRGQKSRHLNPWMAVALGTCSSERFASVPAARSSRKGNLNIDHELIIKCFGAFFAIMNPFMILPLFLTLTSHFQIAEQRQLAIRVAIYATILCAVIFFTGQKVISFFGITVDEFRIAGGLVLAQIAWSMLNGSNVASHHGSETEQDQLAQRDAMAFYPLAFPMAVGPGTIATTIVYSGEAKGVGELAIVGLIILAVIALLFVVLYFASFFGKALSATMRTIMTRVMGMILLSIAVEMAVTGLKSVFPGLA
jgi:multiple antibiotic resistance protein